MADSSRPGPALACGSGRDNSSRHVRARPVFADCPAFRITGATTAASARTSKPSVTSSIPAFQIQRGRRKPGNNHICGGRTAGRWRKVSEVRQAEVYRPEHPSAAVPPGDPQITAALAPIIAAIGPLNATAKSCISARSHFLPAPGKSDDAQSLRSIAVA